MGTRRTVLVTGANRGVGLAILHALALRSPSDFYILGARSAEKGEEAVRALRAEGVRAEVAVLEVDVAADESVRGTVEWVRERGGGLDVLINNAGTALAPSPSNSNLRSTWTATLSTNLTSAACLTTAFLPLLKARPKPLIINVSSARASLTLSTTANLPPTRVIAYSVSKTALNALGIETAKAEPGVRVYSVSPGHCRTGLNGWAGTKDPLDGARVVVELVAGEGREESGFGSLSRGC